MNVLRKLNTLFRAGARESAERITDANAIRIYRQEIVDAESLLEQRRLALAALIATRRDLDKEISTAGQRIARREEQIAGIAPEQRSEDLLIVAARDISATESHLANLQHRHRQVTERIDSEELTLRKLLTEIKEHRRELKILAAQAQRPGSGPQCNYSTTISAQLQTLRETRAGISNTLEGSDNREASMAEAIERVDGDPGERALASRGRDDETIAMEKVLARLRLINSPA
jgi:chromosome segregation ATPase